MKLRSRLLEKSLRGQARAEMRTDGSIWKDYRRHRLSWFRGNIRGNLGTVFVYSYFLFALVIGGVTFERRRLVIIATALYATATTLWRSAKFRIAVLESYDRAVLLHLPISDEDYFDYEWRKYRWSWIRAAGIFLIAYIAVAAGSSQLFRNALPAVIAASLQAGVGLCVSLWLLAKAPKFKSAIASFPFYVLIPTLLWLPGAEIQMLDAATLITPGGWISHAFASFVDNKPWGQIAWVLPAVVLFTTVWASYEMARNHLLEKLVTQTSDELAQNAVVTLEQNIQEPPGHETPFGPEAQLWYGNYLEGYDWAHAGWIENVAARWFSEREKNVAEFMLGDQIGAWTKRWRKAALVAAAGIIVAALVRGSLIPDWILYVIGAIAATFGAPVLGGAWQAFQGTPTSGLLTAAYASFPISYGEISRVMMKSNLVRISVFSPFVIAYSVAVTVHFWYPPAQGAMIGIKLLALTLLLQPVMIAGRFSSGSDDTRHLRWQTFFFFLFCLLLMAVCVAAAIMLFVSDGASAAQVLSVVIIGACCSVCWALYGTLYNRGKVDPLAKPQQ